MNKLYTPRGVTYQWTKDRIEYQLFPEDYFTGADIKIYFGDTLIEDITTLQFVVQETVQPLYGYASYTHEEVARGRRRVEGVFGIVFKEAGLLSSILDHVGKHGYSSPQSENELISIIKGGERKPWHAQVLQNFEELMKQLPILDQNLTEEEIANLDQFAAYKKYENYENSIWGRRSNKNELGLNNSPYFYTSRGSINYQEPLRNGGFDIYLTYGPLEDTINNRVLDKSQVSFNNTVKAIRGVELVASGQTLEVDGTVLELYQFIAKDLD